MPVPRVAGVRRRTRERLRVPTTTTKLDSVTSRRAGCRECTSSRRFRPRRERDIRSGGQSPLKSARSIAQVIRRARAPSPIALVVVDMRDFLGLERVNETTWRFHVTDRLITPGKFLFGGCGLASGVVALEEASGRPTIYAAAHYLSFASLDADVDVVVNLAVEGRRVTQARATASVEGREVLTVNAALGTGELTSPTPWLTMPQVPAPDDCPERTMPRRYDSSIFDHIETRIALGRSFEELDGTDASPVSALWARVPSHLEPSAATLAILRHLVA